MSKTVKGKATGKDGQQNNRGPLHGIRVIDLTIWLQGPIAASILGDLGAEVIKIEHPATGDFSRGAQAAWGENISLPNGNSIEWEMANRNKMGITCNLKTAEGREIVHKLAKMSDVFLTNFTSSALKAFGVDKESIVKQNPEIIYAHGNCFGQEGPDFDKPGLDVNGLARSGFLYASATGKEPAAETVGAISDVLTGTTLAFGVLAALLGRERLGISQATYSSQLGSMMWLQLFSVATQNNFGYEFAPVNRNKRENPLWNSYKCKDGTWLALCLYQSQKFWPDFCEVLNMKHLENDPRFADEAARREHCEELIKIIEAAFATKPFSGWDGILTEKDFFFSKVNTITDLASDPQVTANKYIVELTNGIKCASGPFQLENYTSPLIKAPEQGEHTEKILIERLGYLWNDIERLRDKGAI